MKSVKFLTMLSEVRLHKTSEKFSSTEDMSRAEFPSCNTLNRVNMEQGHIYDGWGLSHGKYIYFWQDHEETWKYTNGSSRC